MLWNNHNLSSAMSFLSTVIREEILKEQICLHDRAKSLWNKLLLSIFAAWLGFEEANKWCKEITMQFA